MTAIVATTSVDVCAVDRLTPELGGAVLVDGRQIALFRLADDRVFAIQNLCPFSGANVMSRGITGSRGEVPTIASPIYKQVFSLVTGECLATMDKETVDGLEPHLVTYPVSVDNGRVILHLAGPS